MHNKVSDKPRYKPSSKSKQKKEKFDDKEKQKAISIESMQEDESNLPSVGCRIRMLVGYGENGEMNATIITTKEEVDIKDNYSWDDGLEFESDPAKSTNSPKIYDLRSPQKKSRKTYVFG